MGFVSEFLRNFGFSVSCCHVFVGNLYLKIKGSKLCLTTSPEYHKNLPSICRLLKLYKLRCLSHLRKEKWCDHAMSLSPTMNLEM